MTTQLFAIILATISIVVSIFTVFDSYQVKKELAALELTTLEKESALDSAAEGETSFVTIDFNDIFLAYQNQSGATDEINQAVAQANTALNQKRSELEALVSEIGTERTALAEMSDDASQEDLEAKQTSLLQKIQGAQTLEKQILESAQRVQQTVNAESAAVRARLFTDLERVIERKAQAQGLTYVVNAQALDRAATPFFLYGMERTDLTGEIMKELGLKAEPARRMEVVPAIAPEQSAASPSEETPDSED